MIADNRCTPRDHRAEPGEDRPLMPERAAALSGTSPARRNATRLSQKVSRRIHPERARLGLAPPAVISFDRAA